MEKAAAGFAVAVEWSAGVAGPGSDVFVAGGGVRGGDVPDDAALSDEASEQTVEGGPAGDGRYAGGGQAVEDFADGQVGAGVVGEMAAEGGQMAGMVCGFAGHGNFPKMKTSPNLRRMPIVSSPGSGTGGGEGWKQCCNYVKRRWFPRFYLIARKPSEPGCLSSRREGRGGHGFSPGREPAIR